MADNKITRDRWEYLIEKYLSNACSERELDELLNIAKERQNKRHLAGAFQKHWEASDGAGSEKESVEWDKLFENLMNDLHQMTPAQTSVKIIHQRWRAVAAAVLVLIIGVGLWKYIDWQPAAQKGIAVVTHKDISPGGNRALLILANGASIALDNVDNGLLAQQGNTKVIKINNGLLAYDTRSKIKDQRSKIQYNTIKTPKGGQYQVVLSDGTKVWLNAVSSLKFPTVFNGKERTVELTGEAYFEVAANKNAPFEVKVSKMKVKVLGTHFNIMAYPDEPVMNTTLLEGAIRVSDGDDYALLKPGQEAGIDPDVSKINISTADTSEVIAWKNEMFVFNNTDLKTIMRQVARWYNVEVTYKGDISDRDFTGTMSRKVSLSHILQVLTLSKVHFNVKGRTITVYNQ